MGISQRGVFYLMVFFSGFTGLLYQILWMRQTALLLGSTSRAAAITLGVFFLGLAAGSWFWGKRSPHLPNLMRTYAWLETGIAAAGIFYLLILNYFHDIYPLIYQAVGPGDKLLLAKCLLTLLMVFPPSFFMGGTIPVLGQFIIRSRSSFGTTAAKIYGINTIGAACGAFATGFLLIALLGFKQTCFVGILITSAIALVSVVLSRQTETNAADQAPAADAVTPTPPPHRDKKSPADKKRDKAVPAKPRPDVSRRFIQIFAFISGFNVLALEVLWTRMFAQVHENSVYSFSTVLIVVLICLSLGALLASRLAKQDTPPSHTLLVLMVTSGIGVCLSPFIFMSLTDGLQMIATDVSFPVYVLQLFSTGFATIGPPCLLLGTVFPFLMKSEERFADQPGKSIGMLSAINTVGAILGSLTCGFILLHYLGMWRSLQIIAASYFVIGLIMPVGESTRCTATKATAAVFLLLAFTLLNPSDLPVTASSSNGRPDTVVETWESSDSTVSVVRNPRDGYAIKVNSNYSLGSSGSAMSQIFQSRIPLLTYPDTQSVFYLGMGTGATAGEALNKQDFRKINEVLVCELSPKVVTASKKYFSGALDGNDYTNGLFTDPRARILVEDGRNHLMVTSAKFDMINADLFLPYQSGTGSLYSLEHFKSARQRLNPGGVFVQWLPLYQVSEYEFGVITRTMLTAFEQVTLWRHNFQPGSEIVALIGHPDKIPLPACDLDVANAKRMAVLGATHAELQELMLPINPQTVSLFYCGNLTAAKDLFDAYPINTDDRPIIEYKTPMSLHRGKDEGKPHFVADKFATLVDKLLETTPPASDPMLAERTSANRDLPLAGAAFHRAWIARVANDEEAWKRHWQEFLKHWIEPPLTTNRSTEH